MDKPKVDTIIASWLKQLPNHLITTPKIEQYLPAYGRNAYGVEHTPGTYARIFRKMRLDPSTPARHGIQIETQEPRRSWRIILN
jgi:hypothetical protein